MISHIYLLTADYKEAYSYLNKARQLALEHNIVRELAESYRKEGILLFKSGQYAESLGLFFKSLKLHKEINSELVFNTLDSITQVYGDLNNLEKNLEYAYLGLDRPEAQGRTVKRGTAEAQHATG